MNEANRLTLTIVNVISSWTVNNYYNCLHQYAVKMHSMGNASSITDAYMNVVNQYLASLNNNEGYKKNIQTLHTYCVDHTTYTGMSFSVWIKEILKQFVPSDYYNIMTNDQQDSALRSIIVGSLNQFSSEIISNTMLLDDIILRSSETKQATIRIMHEIMTRHLLAGRQALFQAVHFASSRIPADKNDIAVKKELTELLKANIELKHELKKANSIIEKQKDVVRKLMSKQKNQTEYSNKFKMNDFDRPKLPNSSRDNSDKPKLSNLLRDSSDRPKLSKLPNLSRKYSDRIKLLNSALDNSNRPKLSDKFDNDLERPSLSKLLNSAHDDLERPNSSKLLNSAHDNSERPSLAEMRDNLITDSEEPKIDFRSLISVVRNDEPKKPPTIELISDDEKKDAVIEDVKSTDYDNWNDFGG